MPQKTVCASNHSGNSVAPSAALQMSAQLQLPTRSNSRAGVLRCSFPGNPWRRFRRAKGARLAFAERAPRRKLDECTDAKNVATRTDVVVAVGAVAGCGAEVAGTAAASAKLQATQASQAKAQEAQFKKQLGEAMQATEAAASAAGNQ